MIVLNHCHSPKIKHRSFHYLSIQQFNMQGQIGYAIVPIIATGIMLGSDKPVILHLLDIEQVVESLNGIRMEMTDVAFPLLKGLVATTDIVEACKDVNIAIMLGGYPWKEIMLRKDMLSTNVSIYKAKAFGLGGA